MSQVVGACRYCGGSIIEPLGSTTTVCPWCADAPRRARAIKTAERAQTNDYCADIHRLFARLAHKRGDTETATAREDRAAQIARPSAE